MSRSYKRRVLVVDDEPDVCEMVVDVLSDYRVDTAGSFDTARSKLESDAYDVVILDIMGVKGHELLSLFGRQIPCIMLTAHALTAEEFKRSVTGNARLFLPKEELGNLDLYISKVLETNDSLWGWLIRKVDFRQWFGTEWIDGNLLEDLTIEEIMEDLNW